MRYFVFLLTAALLGLLPAAARAQGGRGYQDRRDRIEALRVAYLTREANITAEEGQAFWPVYNEYQDLLDRARRENRMDLAETRINFNAMSDADLARMMDAQIAFMQKEVDLFRTYHARFLKLLPTRKLAAVYRAERQFKREMLVRLRDGK